MKRHLLLAVLLFCVASTARARPSSAERKLVAVKADLMSADYRADLPGLESGRLRAEAVSGDSQLGYLADYWSGFASWRIVVNGAGTQMTPEEAKSHLARAVVDFE